MAKLKAAKSGRSKKKAANWSRSVPCVVILVSGFLLLTLLLASILSTASK
jgi:hypothetical protein